MAATGDVGDIGDDQSIMVFPGKRHHTVHRL